MINKTKRFIFKKRNYQRYFYKSKEKCLSGKGLWSAQSMTFNDFMAIKTIIGFLGSWLLKTRSVEKQALGTCYKC
jgi:hypothetical protein